jgi:hypothetical protein
VDSLDLNAPPGTYFQYGPSHYYAFGVLLERKLHNAGRMINPLQYLESEIFDSIGFNYQTWVHDSTGNPHIPNGCYATARNWAKYGQFMLQKGRWGTSQIIDSTLVKNMYVATGPNPGHGYFCWLNNTGGQGASPAQSAPPGSPGGFIYHNGFTDIIGGLGAGKNRMYLIPSLNAVVIRQTLMGNDNFSDHVFLSLMLDRLTSVDEIEIPNHIISPNPASEYIEIQPSEGFEPSEGYATKIYNTFGECVLTVGIQNFEPLQRIDISHLPVGLYFIQIGNYTEKFMVVR